MKRCLPLVVAFIWASNSVVSVKDAGAQGFPEPSNYFTFGAFEPEADATNVPLDLRLTLYGVGCGVRGSPIVVNAFADRVEIAVTASDGTPVAGVLLGSFDQTTVETGWVADELLAPNTQYHVVATLADQGSRPTEVTGPEALDFSFETGEGVTPPLMLDGELAVSIDGAVAHVIVPPAHGGYESLGF